MKKYLHKEALLWGIGLIILYLFSWQLIHYFYNQQVITQQNRFLIEQAQTLSRISQNRAEKIIQLAPQYVQNENERLTLIDGKTGKILFDTFESQLQDDSRKNRPEVKAILDGNETGQAIRESQTLHKEMMYVTLALQSKG
ncbi:two-component sensor histidine kinase, partial [Enterococcus cecorum]|nr:two-component sensor histidine kinase [Enterococcus cecorum]